MRNLENSTNESDEAIVAQLVTADTICNFDAALMSAHSTIKVNWLAPDGSLFLQITALVSAGRKSAIVDSVETRIPPCLFYNFNELS